MPYKFPAESESGWGINFAHQGEVIFASWFTYDLTGKGLWLVMTAPNTGSNIFSGTLLQVSGPAFDAVPFDPNQIVRNAWGTLRFTFIDCNHGTVDFNSVIGYGAGSMNLTRLTQPLGLNCP